MGESAASRSASLTVSAGWGAQSVGDRAMAVGLRANLGEETGVHFFSQWGTETARSSGV
jgi:hypothetical protein